MIRDTRTETQRAIDAHKKKLREYKEQGIEPPIADWDPWNLPKRPGTRVLGMGKSCFDKD